jgi:hypothetical protein
VVPGGTGSFTTTLVAAAGPLFVTVIRKTSELPTPPGFGEALFVIDKSTLAGLTTFKFTGTECINDPDCPETVIVWFAMGVLEAVEIVSVAVLAFPSLMFTNVGLKTADAPVGKPVALRFTVPVKAANGVIVIVY